MRCTEETLIPAVLAIMPAVQWVVSPSGSVCVRATTRAATSAPKGGMREGRVLSRNSPSTPACMKRSCQRHTQVLLLPVRRMISTVPRSSPVKRTIRARHTCLRAIAIRDDRFQTSTIGGAYVDDDILAHPPDSHPAQARGIPFGFFRQVFSTLMSAVPSSRQASSWLSFKRLFQAVPGKAGDAVVMTTVDHTLMRGSEPHDR